MSTQLSSINQVSCNVDMTHSVYYTLFCCLLANSLLFACSDQNFDESQNETLKTTHQKADENQSDLSQDRASYIDTNFGIYTEVGETLLMQSQAWETLQIDGANEFAQPRMCAHNVSHVLEMSGVKSYSDYLVPHMLDAVSVRGGLVTQLDTRDKQGFIKSLNGLFDGHLPVGSLINGCLYKDCSGEGGDGHIAILGETDAEGVVYLYHNNWYRPDNEGGERKPFMVNKEYYDEHNLRRQWMKTPWIRVHRDVMTEEIVDVEGLLPAIDDLDPFTGFFITVSIIPEILQVLNSSPLQERFCPAGMKANTYLGACTTDDNEDGDVYGLFPNAMVQDCIDRNYGQACSTKYTLEEAHYSISVYRWSRAVYESLRGDSACANGLQLDHDIGYCVQPADEELGLAAEAFGPFPTEVVERCFDWGGGNACASGRMSLEFFKSLLGYDEPRGEN